MTGRYLMGEQMNKSQSNIEHSINVSRLAKREYNLQLIIGNNKSETISLIKF